MNYTVREIPLDKIKVSDQQLRYEPEDDSIIELANDIVAHGLLQPVGVSAYEDGTYTLLWGGRRLAAHRRLRRTSIFTHVYDPGDSPVKAVALIENLQRVQLTLQEECDGIAYLHYEEKKSPDQISALLSKSRSWVMRRLSLPNLPVELRGPVFDGRLSIGAAEELCKLTDDGARSYLATQAIQCGWTQADVRTAVETYIATPSMESAVAAGQKVTAEQGKAAEPMAVCAACQRAAPYSELASVWIHSAGCSNSPREGDKGGEHGRN